MNIGSALKFGAKRSRLESSKRISKQLLIVDREVSHQSGQIIIAVLNDESFVKRLRVAEGQTWLDSENPASQTIGIEPDDDFEVFGVVTFTIHAPNSKTGV